MTSQIRVDEITNRSGLGTVTIYDNGFEFTGVTTFTENVDIEGNLTIGGVLTYEDTTNIDSVGVITARAGVNVSGGNLQVGGTNVINSGRVLYNLEQIKLADTKELVLGSGNDLKIQHSGSHSFISQEGVGALKIKGDDIRFEDAGGTEALRIDDVGRLLIGRTSTLQSSAERLTIDSGMALFRRSHATAAAVYIRNEDSTADTRNPYLIFTDGSGNRGGFGIQNDQSSLWISGQNGIAFRTSGSAPSQEERLRITSAGLVGIGTDNPGSLLTLDHATNPAIQFRDSGTKVASINAEGTQTNIASFESKDLVFATSTSSAFTERLRITSDGKVGINQTSPTAPLSIKVGSGGEYVQDFSGSATKQFGFFYDQNNWNAATFRIDEFDNNGTATSRLTITDGGKVGINDTNPTRRLSISNGSADSDIISMYNDEVGINFGAWGTGSSYPREVTINGTRFDSGSSPFLRIGGQGGIKFCADLNNERMRITPSGEVNIGGSDLTSTAYAFQVSRDLGTPSASGASIARFRNANSTYSQDLYLKFNNSKDIMWAGGSGNGGMTWQMGTRGYNWEIGGTNRFSVGPSDVAITGATDGVLNINTSDARGSFIRFQENGTTKVWIGSGEGMGAGDQDDACLMSVDNIYFRNSTDSVTTLTVSREGRLTGNKRYPDASGTQRSNPYYPPTNHYQTYSAPSGGNKWMRFAYFASRGRYRITFNSTGGHYSPGSVTFDFGLTWSSPHAYVGNISKLGPQYVTKFRVTTDSSGSAYYGEVYVSVNGNQTGSHIHCTAQVIGTADREFNLHNYGYDLSTLTHTSGDFTL